MGLIIKVAGALVVGDVATAPVPIEVILECDRPVAFFCSGIGVFKSEAGFVGCHEKAMKAGWLERNSPQGRLWICPECSGK